jgi:hypothetical protein
LARGWVWATRTGDAGDECLDPGRHGWKHVVLRSSSVSTHGAMSCFSCVAGPKNVVIRNSCCCTEMTAMTTFRGVRGSYVRESNTEANACRCLFQGAQRGTVTVACRMPFLGSSFAGASLAGDSGDTIPNSLRSMEFRAQQNPLAGAEASTSPTADSRLIIGIPGTPYRIP